MFGWGRFHLVWVQFAISSVYHRGGIRLQTMAVPRFGALLDQNPEIPSDTPCVRVTSGPAAGLIGRVVSASHGRLLMAVDHKAGVYLEVAEKIVEPCTPPQNWAAASAK